MWRGVFASVKIESESAAGGTGVPICPVYGEGGVHGVMLQRVTRDPFDS